MLKLCAILLSLLALPAVGQEAVTTTKAGQVITGEKQFAADKLCINGSTSGKICLRAAAVAGTTPLDIGTGGTLVSGVSVATANGISGTSSGGATPALTLTLGSITPGEVDAVGSIATGGDLISGSIGNRGSLYLYGAISGYSRLLTQDDAGNGAIYLPAGSATLMANPMTTGGDVIYGGASGVPTRLANGSAGQVLTSSGTTLAPTWETPAAGGATLVANTFTGAQTITGGTVTASTPLLDITQTWNNAAVSFKGLGANFTTTAQLATGTYYFEIKQNNVTNFAFGRGTGGNPYAYVTGSLGSGNGPGYFADSVTEAEGTNTGAVLT